MERRVGNLEKDVAVLGNRLDTAESEIDTIRKDIRILSSKLDKATGILIFGMFVAQYVGSLMRGG